MHLLDVILLSFDVIRPVKLCRKIIPRGGNRLAPLPWILLFCVINQKHANNNN